VAYRKKTSVHVLTVLTAICRKYPIENSRNVFKRVTGYPLSALTVLIG